MIIAELSTTTTFQNTVTIVLQEGNNLFPVELKLIFTCKHALCLFFIAVSM